MNSLIPRQMNRFTILRIADGTKWYIIPSDDRAIRAVIVLARTMRLQQLINTKIFFDNCYTLRRIIIQVKNFSKDSTLLSTADRIIVNGQDTIYFTMFSEKNNGFPLQSLIRLSMIIVRDAQYRGGVLLHGALAVWNGKGVILAGPGGRGKTTASRRLPSHWHSYCDDTTLVVLDKRGFYWAHPWPTWSKFMFNGSGGTWDVQHAAKLKGIFFLKHANEDKFEPLEIAQRVCLLISSAEQVSWSMPGHLDKNVVRELRLQRFDNICDLARTVPSYILHICPNGTFWREIERALSG